MRVALQRRDTMSTMTDTPLSTHPNIRIVDGIGQYHSGTGKVLKPGDRFKVAGAGQFSVTLIYVQRNNRTGEEEVLVDGYGGKRHHLGLRTFHVDRCERIVSEKTEDPNEGLRDAVKQASDAAQRGKRFK
jgi:hypothetical protein